MLVNEIFTPLYRPFNPWLNDKVHHNYFSISKNDRTPYIIRRQAHDVGLFSYFITILGGIAYAEQKGYIPVIDMKHHPNAYLYDSEVGKVNAWEYYFEQPGNLSLEEALSSRKYIMGKDTALHTMPSQSASAFYNEDGMLTHWRTICKKYIHFTRPVLERLEHMTQQTLGKRIVGVLVRGTDYVALKPKGHPIPPTAEQAIAKTREVMQEKGFDSVYLATEDKIILAKFQEAFGERLLLPEADYLSYDYDDPKLLYKYHADRENDKYIRGLEYLVSMLFLSRCPGLITAITSGSTAVMCLSDSFDYLYVFDLGLYP